MTAKPRRAGRPLATRFTATIRAIAGLPALVRRACTLDRVLPALDAFAMSYFGVHTTLSAAAVHLDQGLPGSTLLESARVRVLLGYLLTFCLLVLCVRYTASTQDAGVPAICFVAGLLKLSYLRLKTTHRLV